MQYVLIDSHQRFLGTMDCDRRMVVGDTFQRDNAQTYAVIGVNRAQQNNPSLPSLTVLRMQAPKLVAIPDALLDSTI